MVIDLVQLFEMWLKPTTIDSRIGVMCHYFHFLPFNVSRRKFLSFAGDYDCYNVS